MSSCGGKDNFAAMFRKRKMDVKNVTTEIVKLKSAVRVREMTSLTCVHSQHYCDKTKQFNCV